MPFKCRLSGDVCWSARVFAFNIAFPSASGTFSKSKGYVCSQGPSALRYPIHLQGQPKGAFFIQIPYMGSPSGSLPSSGRSTDVPTLELAWGPSPVAPKFLPNSSVVSVSGWNIGNWEERQNRLKSFLYNPCKPSWQPAGREGSYAKNLWFPLLHLEHIIQQATGK